MPSPSRPPYRFTRRQLPALAVLLGLAAGAPTTLTAQTATATEALERALAAARQAEQQAGAPTALGSAAATTQNETFALLGQASGAEIEKQNDRIKKFIGWDWNLGVALAYDLDGERIDTAAVVNGLVRVENESRAAPRIVAAIHYFWPVCATDEPCSPRRQPTATGSNPATGPGLLQPTPLPRFGWGPFVGIQSSQNDLIDSFVTGLMVGWPTGDGDQSFNVGLGLVFDSKVKTLGDGLRANQPLPAGETAVRFKTEDRLGAMLLFSFNW
jgi:hypothetical protein